jgi:hypothetical protein
MMDESSEEPAIKRQRVTLGYALEVVWPAQWLSLATSAIGVLTLGTYVPDWPLTYMMWALKRRHRREHGGAQ